MRAILGKTFLTLFLTASLSAFSQDHGHDHDESHLEEAPVVLAGVHSIEIFKEAFEKDGSSLGAELIGFESKGVAGDIEVAVFSTSGKDKIKSSLYDCHLHGASAHCDFLEESDSKDYQAAKGSFTAEEFELAAVSAVTLFEEAIAEPSLIQKATFWRSYDLFSSQANIQVKLEWKNAQNAVAESFLYCHHHQHGDGEAEMDCHRQRKAGPFQP
ncbi:hypothetical protein GW915_10945 [bacterium]|nr:hypothetical protein [bacterium]